MSKIEGKKATYTLKNFSKAQKYSYRPPKDTIVRYHHAKQGETWETVAKQYFVPTADLIQFVFPAAVTRDGLINPKAVNEWMFHHQDYRSPRTPDGKNAMFARGQIIPIPDPFLLRQKRQSAPRKIHIGEDDVCGDPITIHDRRAVFAEPPQWVGAVQNQHGELFEYGVFMPAEGAQRRIVILNSAGEEVKTLRPAQSFPEGARDYVDQMVISTLGIQISTTSQSLLRANAETLKRVAKKEAALFWAEVPRFIWVTGERIRHPSATDLDKAYEDFRTLEQEFERAEDGLERGAASGVRG